MKVGSALFSLGLACAAFTAGENLANALDFVVDRQGILRRNGSSGEAEVNVPVLESLVTPLLGQP